MPVISPWVRAADVDGLIVVMDLQTSELYIFDEDASTMWKALRIAQGHAGSAGDALSRQEESAHLVGRFADFVADCEARGFVVPQGRLPDILPTPLRRCRMSCGESFLAVRAWLTMLTTDATLRRRGFATTYLSLEHVSREELPRRGTDAIDAARRAFMRAENFYLRSRAPRDCLPRSLALYVFLRARGVPATHKIGARRFPTFRCHAWVECDGEPILDQRDTPEGYTVISAIHPSGVNSSATARQVPGSGIDGR